MVLTLAIMVVVALIIERAVLRPLVAPLFAFKVLGKHYEATVALTAAVVLLALQVSQELQDQFRRDVRQVDVGFPIGIHSSDIAPIGFRLEG